MSGDICANDEAVRYAFILSLAIESLVVLWSANKVMGVLQSNMGLLISLDTSGCPCGYLPVSLG